MSDMPSLIAQQEIVDQLARELQARLSPGDECIYYSTNWVGSFAQVECLVVRPDGELDFPIGRADSISPPKGEFVLAELRLRAACYQEGKGTWLGFELAVTQEGEVTAKYNYDTEPVWTRPIEPTIYVQEQEKYPRDLEHQPEWFKRRLAEGQAALDEWRSSNGLA